MDILPKKNYLRFRWKVWKLTNSCWKSNVVAFRLIWITKGIDLVWRLVFPYCFWASLEGQGHSPVPLIQPMLKIYCCIFSIRCSTRTWYSLFAVTLSIFNNRTECIIILSTKFQNLHLLKSFWNSNHWNFWHILIIYFLFKIFL